MKGRLVSRYEGTHEGGLVVHVDPKARWADGEPFDAGDICFSIDAVLNPANPVPWATEHRRVLAGCNASDDGTTATVHYLRKVHNPREWLSIAMLPEHAFSGTTIPEDHPFSREAFGSYGMRATLEEEHAHFRHPGGPPPHISHFEWRAEGDLEALKAGELHGLVRLEDWGAVVEDESLALKHYDRRDVWFVAVRRRGALRRLDTRTALDAAVDRDALRPLWGPADEFRGSEPITGPYVGASPYNNRSVTPRPLSEEPLKLKPLRLGVSATHEALVPGLADAIAAQLRQRGLTVDVVQLEDEIDASNAGGLDLALLRWVSTHPEHARPLFASDGALNPFGTTSPATESAMAAMEASSTDRAYQDAAHVLHAAAHSEVHAIWLMHGVSPTAWSTDVRLNIIGPHTFWDVFGTWRFEE
ncbi:MAG: hypothetical protein KC912_26070 [Proteobacteria bacterium]|nr:hypothetical protein [Pseudomonadota bacterium]